MKKTIFGFVLGLIVSGTVVFAANYLYQADEVSYTPSNNEWNVDNVDDALRDLYNRISDSNAALTNLKDIAIAKAVDANGNDFSSVINKLGTIVNQGNKSFTISDTNAITIPAGYYNGQGTIMASGLVPTPTGSKNITANGSNIDVKNYATVNVNVSNSAIYLGEFSSNTTIDVSDLGATSVDQFLAVCNQSASQRNQSGYIGMIDTSYVYTQRSYTPPTISFVNNKINLTVGQIYSVGGAYGNVHHYQQGTTNLVTKVYYVGNIKTR